LTSASWIRYICKLPALAKLQLEFNTDKFSRTLPPPQHPGAII
jgi:hypothetical protein